MQPPRVVDLSGGADGQDVGGAVADPYAGACGGDLHDRLRVVGGRVVARLVGGADADAGAVVEGPVVQAGRAALGGADHAGHGGGAVGGEDRLAGLDLDLEADPSGRQPVGVLEGLQQPHESGDLLRVGHLGQGQHQPVGQTSGPHQAGEEDVRGADSPVPYAGLHALHTDARVRGGGPVGVRLGDQSCGTGRRLVLLGVRAQPVAVLEVDAQVLHRFPLQLGAYAVVHGLGEFPRDGQDLGERGGVRGVCVERGQRPVAPGARGPGLEGVGGDVDGVDGLAGAGVPRVPPGEFGVHGGEGGADLLADRTGEARRHLLLLTHDHALHLLKVSTCRNESSAW